MSRKTKEEIAQTALEESYSLVTKPRFGLFGQPASLAISETNYFKATICHKDKDGKVPEALKSFTTSPVKKGGVDSVLFSKPGYNSIGEPYIDPGKFSLRASPKDGHIKAGHDKAFMPAKDTMRRVKSEFEFMPGGQRPKPSLRAAAGEVITAPRNFLVSKPKNDL